jgi:hypothetical protein
MLAYSVVGIGTHMLTLADPERREVVLKIPADDRYCDQYWRRRLAFLSSRLTKRRASTHRSWPTDVGLALRDVLFSRDRTERQQHFAGVLDALSIVIRNETARRFLAASRIEPCVSIGSIGGRRGRYIGPCIVQERAARFIGPDGLGREDLVLFRRSNASALHIALWTLGVGLAATRETWGPVNWGITHDGRLALFDFSSLTTRRRHVERAIGQEASAGAETYYASLLGTDPTRLHFGLVRAQINYDRLASVWPA